MFLFFNENSNAKFLGDENGDVDVNEVKILHKRDVKLFSDYRSQMIENKQPSNEAEIEEFAMLVGKECAQRILIYRH